MKRTTTHLAPWPSLGYTPCCGKTVFELPSGDRITRDVAKVTCGKEGR